MKPIKFNREVGLPKRRNIPQYIFLAYGMTLASGLMSPAVFGQSAAKPADAKEEQAIEQVVVTARKVKEKLQEVPMSISAFSSKTLENSGVATLQGLSNLTPGLSLNDPGTEVGFATSPVIRGTPNISGGADPNVSVFLDGVYIANLSSISLGLISIDRVEVVKGPVSALYGRNAFGGAINYVSKRAPEYFTGNAEITTGTGGQQTYKGTVGGPIVEGILSASIGGFYDKFKGTYQDQVNGLKRGGREKKDVQATFAFTPTKDIDVTGAWYHGDDFFQDPAQAYTENNCGPKIAAGVTAGQFSRFCGVVDYNQRPVEVAAIPSGAGSTGNKRKVDSANIRASMNLGFADLSGIFGYNNVTQRSFADFLGRRDGIPFTLAPGPGTINLLELFGADGNNKDKSVEIRLATKQNQPLRGSVGGYYYDATNTLTTIIGIDGSRLPAGQGIVGATQNFFLTSNGQLSTTNFTQTDNTDKIKSWFGAAEYDILSNLTASVEFRKTNQEKSQDILRNSFIPNTVRPLGVFPASSFDYNNYHAALSYKITPDIMVYVSNGNGTKAGGFNQRATFLSELTFQPEKSKSTEIGAKTSWFDNRVQLNAAAYDTKTRDIQFTGASDDPTNVGLVTKNFGGTNNKGYELELVAKPSKGLRLNVGYAYTDPKFIAGTYDFSNAALCLALPTCGAGRVVTGLRSASGVVRSAVDLNGITPPRVSKRMVSSGVEFSEKLGMYNWFTRIDYRYESKQNVGETNLATTQLPDRSVVNVRSSVSWGAFTVTGYINNLTNSTVPAIVTYNVRLNDFVGNLVSYLPPERTFGLTLGYKF